LSALEKQDAEYLSLLRADQEVSLLNLIRVTRQKQIDEANANIDVLKRGQDVVLERFTQFQKLLGPTEVTKDDRGLPVVQQSSSLAVAAGASGEGSGLGLIRDEVDQFNWAASANTYTQIANAGHLLAGIIALIPDSWAGDALVAGATFGGSFLSGAANQIANAIQMLAVDANYHATQSGMLGGYSRRQDDWVYQSRLARAEYTQLEQQIVAAQIRSCIATNELTSHDCQIANAQKVDDFLRSKFTSQDLYSWMCSQVADVYFRVYQLALDQAQRAEKAYQHELGLYGQDLQFIQTDNWDNLKRGLLAGEHLYQDLQRLQSAYLGQNVREFEITKNISLLQLDPGALISLRVQGTCTFDVPEALFDLDFPGHYMRRIKMVSLSIPCVVGPYAGVNVTLQLTKSRTRISADSAGYSQSESDPHFTSTSAAVMTTVTSHAQQDSGLFEPSMRDERYLPFEGAGVISSWSLTLPDGYPLDSGQPNGFRPFDYDTISDVVLHIRYTSRDGGQDLRNSCQKALTGALNALKSQGDGTNGGGLARLFSLRHEFPTEWSRLINLAASGPASQEFAITKNRFPFLFSSSSITVRISGGGVYSVARPDAASTDFPDYLKIYAPANPPNAEASLPVTATTPIGKLQGVTFAKEVTVDSKEENAEWKLEADDIDAFRKNVRDILIVYHYGVSTA
jgi:hypothetical protein